MLREEVKSFVLEKKLIFKGDRIAVAVSGGADSLCLLHILLNLREDTGIELYAAHLNHSFRKESEEEFEYVRLLAKTWQLPFYGARIDVPAYRRKKGLSSQVAARECRYYFLLKALHHFKGNKIATGHHGDDRAETVLMNIISGCGLKGLSGIGRETSVNGVPVVRPLLETSRAAINDYCLCNNIHPVEDESNQKEIYLRNKVRLKLIPYLKKNYNPNVTDTLLRLSHIAEADEDYLEKISQKLFLLNSRIEREGVLSLDAVSLKKHHISIQRRIIIAAWKKLSGGNYPRLSNIQVQSVVSLLLRDETGKKISLPKMGMALYESGRLYFFIDKEINKEKDFPAISLKIPGKTSIIPLEIFFETFLVNSRELNWPPDEKKEAYFDFEKLSLPIQVRKRRAGDYIRPLGMKGQKKKLKDLFNDKRTGSSFRNQVPLLLSGDDIIWVTGLAVAEKYRVAEDTEKVLVVRYHRLSDNLL